jgi:hypothetical protein
MPGPRWHQGLRTPDRQRAAWRCAIYAARSEIPEAGRLTYMGRDSDEGRFDKIVMDGSWFGRDGRCSLIRNGERFPAARFRRGRAWFVSLLPLLRGIPRSRGLEPAAGG